MSLQLINSNKCIDFLQRWKRDQSSGCCVGRFSWCTWSKYNHPFQRSSFLRRVVGRVSSIWWWTAQRNSNLDPRDDWACLLCLWVRAALYIGNLLFSPLYCRGWSCQVTHFFFFFWNQLSLHLLCWLLKLRFFLFNFWVSRRGGVIFTASSFEATLSW